MLHRQHLAQMNQRRMMEARRHAAAQAARTAANPPPVATASIAAADGDVQMADVTASPTSAKPETAVKQDAEVKMEDSPAASGSRQPPSAETTAEGTPKAEGAQADDSKPTESSRGPPSAVEPSPAAPSAAIAPQLDAPAAEVPTANGDGQASQQAPSVNADQAQDQQARLQQAGQQQQIPMPQAPRMPQELLDEILSILKTAFPLLALSMEKMVDHINVRALPPKEEDVYRFFFALLSDALGVSNWQLLTDALIDNLATLQQWASKIRIPKDDEDVPQQTRDKIKMFIHNLSPEIKEPAQQQFLQKDLKLREYIRRMSQWHDRYERALDARPRREPLDLGQCLLSDFHHNKFDDVEVPGQYIEHVDSNADFAKIGRFSPELELARGYGFCFRRITMIGSNGSIHTFAVQSPSGRHCRREERLTQLFRIMNT